MVKLTFLILAAGASVFLVPQNRVPDQTVTRSFDGYDTHVQGMGVCDLTAERVTCWDMDGNPSPGLTERLTARLKENNGQDPSFRFGKKNRWLAVSTDSYNVNLQVPQSNGYSSIELNGRDQERVHLLRVAVDNAEETGSVDATFSRLPGPNPVTIPFRAGEKANFDGVQIEIGSWKPSNSHDLNRFPPMGGPNTVSGKEWRVVFGWSVQSATDRQYYSVLALDKDNKPIRHVDTNGRPISDVKFLEETRDSSPYYIPGNPTSKYLAATVQLSGGLQSSTPDAMVAMTNIDPSTIGSIVVSSFHEKTVRIGGFPLDSK